MSNAMLAADTGMMFIKNSTKPISPALLTMMLGGSPTIVADPPIFEAKIAMIRDTNTCTGNPCSLTSLTP